MDFQYLFPVQERPVQAHAPGQGDIFLSLRIFRKNLREIFILLQIFYSRRFVSHHVIISMYLRAVYLSDIVILPHPYIILIIYDNTDIVPLLYHAVSHLIQCGKLFRYPVPRLISFREPADRGFLECFRIQQLHRKSVHILEIILDVFIDT